jgi:hypothetical protein
MNNQDDLQPINRNYIIFGTIFIVIFSFVVYGLLSRNQNQQSKPITSTQPSTANGNGNQSNLIKYDEDSDGDKIPNFMEEFLGSNVYASEISECEKTNLTCQESPLNTIHNINIILDASTSMNILGNKNSKIQEVRNNMKFTITSELTAPYFKTSIYSFGNRGTTGNIPDNESCVAVLRHKSLTTSSNDPRVLSNDFLNNYLPNGKSPLAYTLDQVSKTLNKNEKNLIIVITDGMDDCNGDVKGVISQIKNSGTALKIDIATYFANEDANLYLREAVESNNGDFSQNPNITDFLIFSSRNFIKENWCKVQGFQKLKNCIDTKYKTANSYLNDQKNNKNLGEDEKIKISNTQSVMSFFQETNIRRYQTQIDNEFSTYFKKEN